MYKIFRPSHAARVESQPVARQEPQSSYYPGAARVENELYGYTRGDIAPMGSWAQLGNQPSHVMPRPEPAWPLQARNGAAAFEALGSYYATEPPYAAKEPITMVIASHVVTITPDMIRARRIVRLGLGSADALGIVSYMHDILSASFVPLTANEESREKITAQAIEFLSVFKTDATWHVNVRSVFSPHGRPIYGLSDYSRKVQITARFLRLRFPFVRFEWQLETPYYMIREFMRWPNQAVKISVLWKAWARAGASPNLVAYGYCKDKLLLTDGGEIVISERQFVVSNVFQPELMTPVPYLRENADLQPQNDFIIFSTSQAMIQSLRSSQRMLGFLVALSALFASLQPIIDKFSKSGGWILAGIGVTAGLITVVTVLIDVFLRWIERHAAQVRQRV